MGGRATTEQETPLPGLARPALRSPSESHLIITLPNATVQREDCNWSGLEFCAVCVVCAVSAHGFPGLFIGDHGTRRNGRAGQGTLRCCNLPAYSKCCGGQGTFLQKKKPPQKNTGRWQLPPCSITSLPLENAPLITAAYLDFICFAVGYL